MPITEFNRVVVPAYALPERTFTPTDLQFLLPDERLGVPGNSSDPACYTKPDRPASRNAACASVRFRLIVRCNMYISTCSYRSATPDSGRRRICYIDINNSTRHTHAFGLSTRKTKRENQTICVCFNSNIAATDSGT